MSLDQDLFAPGTAQHRLDATKSFGWLDDAGEREELDPPHSAGETESPTLSATGYLDEPEVSPVEGVMNALESTSPSAGALVLYVPSEEDVPGLIPVNASDINDDAQDDNMEEQVDSDAASTSILHTSTDGLSSIPSATVPTDKTTHDANTLVTVPETDSTVKGRTRKRVTFGEDTVAGTGAQPVRPDIEDFELDHATECRDESMNGFRKQEALPSKDTVPTRSCLRSEAQVFPDFTPEPRPEIAPRSMSKMSKLGRRVFILPPPQKPNSDTPDSINGADDSTGSLSAVLPETGYSDSAPDMQSILRVRILSMLLNEAKKSQSCSAASDDHGLGDMTATQSQLGVVV